MNRSRIAAIAVAGLYGLLWVSLYFTPDAFWKETLPQLPIQFLLIKPFGFLLVSVIGPALLLMPGLELVWLSVALMVSVVGCIAWSRYLFRHRQDELFAGPLLASAVIWIGSGWLAVAFAFVITS